MRLRVRYAEDEAFDGLTAEDIRRIRGGAEASVTPGLGELHKIAVGIADGAGTRPSSAGGGTGDPTAQPKNKRGRRA